MADTLVIDLDSLFCAKDNADKARGQVDQIKGSVPLATVATAMPSGSAASPAAASAGSHIDGLAKRIADSLDTFSTALQDATNQYNSTDQHTAVDFSQFSTKISGRVE